MPRLKNARYELFAQAYAKCGCGKDAAIEAGYSAKTARTHGSKLLTILDIKNRIDELMATKEDDTICSIEERKQILTELARGKLSDYQMVTPDGDVILEYTKDSPNPRAVQEVTENIIVSNDTVEIRAKKLKMHGPIKAIAELNKMDGAYPPAQIKHDGTFNINFGTPDGTE